MTETIAQTLGAKDGLAEHIGERELLLLLDNLEQVVEAAPELSALLRPARTSALLVTSRELLRVQGEVEYPVPPLAEPEAVDALLRARAARADGRDRRALRRLDDLPLAVELAAARTKRSRPRRSSSGSRSARPAQGRPRRRPAPADAAGDDRLELRPALRGGAALFARLSVFAGGCTLEAAEEVADADLDTLQSLVEKSLLRFTNERYWMLETIREYAGERLRNECEDSEIFERHTRWYLRLAKSAHGELRGPSQGEWFALLNADLENLRSAIRWAQEP